MPAGTGKDPRFTKNQIGLGISMHGMKWLAAGPLVAVLTGCGAGKMLVLKPSTQADFKASSVVVQVEKASVKAPSEVESKFQTSLAQELYGQNGFTQGNALILRYRFIGFQPGSQFKRWMMGAWAIRAKRR